MAPPPAKSITFLVPGQVQPVSGGTTRGTAAISPAAGLKQGRLAQSVRLGTQRGAGGEARVTAVPGEDVVVLHLAGGPALMLHPETARDLMLAQDGVARGHRARDVGRDEVVPAEVKVPARLEWRGLEQGVASRGTTRGFFGDVLLSGVDVITGLFTDEAADFAASAVVGRFDAQVDPGVYALEPESLPRLKGNRRPLEKVPAAPGAEPLLVLIHGTFSETHGTFSKLWTQHPERVRTLFERYGGRVYALDHPTLGASPMANALTLVRALPQNARIHLLTHSRGGLVAEVLAQVCGNPDDQLRPFTSKAYKEQRDDLRKLADLVKERAVRVDRIVRVACPARGTLLASKRLDAYLSVFKWTLELAGIPVLPVLVEFLGEVARRRADPGMLPGLAAQIPDSPLMKWMHAVEEPLAGGLRVVAGDLQGDSVTSWLKTLLADAFYWTDNDLVVQTRSMYGGAPRAAGASFLLDQGGKVSHFGYFTNERTAEAIVHALVQDTVQDFRTIGPLSWGGASSTGVRGAVDGGPGPDAPAVFLLPGMLGSNLKIGHQRIWLDGRAGGGLERLGYDPRTPDGVEPDGPIGAFYDRLADFLSKTHHVIEFGFDWRRPIEEEARRLAAAVEEALEARRTTGQPVRIVAHSMGGLVARTVQLERPDVWERMMATPGARLLMLGTPNGGTWSPMQVLSGDDTFGNTLVSNAPFEDYTARTMLAQCPGFIQLQAALLDADLALGRRDTWQQRADEDLERIRQRSSWHGVDIQLDPYRWGVPSQEVLDGAVALRKRLDAQRDKDLGGFADKLALVVGRARFTPDGYEVGEEGLWYLDLPEEGDGRVTHRSAMLPGVRTWALDCDHGDLPSRKDAFEAYLELLQKGTTDLLTPLPAVPASRGTGVPATPHVRSRPSRTRITGRPPQSEGEMYAEGGGPSLAGPAAPGTALRVTVVNGDLTFVREPLLLGHYRSMRLTGTERVMDRLVGGAMKDSLRLSLYPDPPGTHQMFLNEQLDPANPWRLPRPEAVIVIGLGEEGKLRPTELAYSVRQGVIAWAQRLAERPGGTPALFELAATLVGSGGTGITVAESAQSLVQGVREANDRLDDGSADVKWPRVSHLHLIELYLDRATEAWRALQMQATATPGRYVVTETVKSGVGALRRPIDSGYRGADYDFITAVTQDGRGADSSIAYTLDSKRARTEVRAQVLQGRLMRELVASASNDANGDTRIGRTLFQLLVPMEIEAFLGGSTEMLIELDSGTAGVPWELLDTGSAGGGDPEPWAIRAKLLRKLRTTDFRARVIDADAESSVLVIGEPKCDATVYPRLAGAREEASAVATRLGEPGALGIDKVTALISPDDPARSGPDAGTVINALMERDWRIVHIAGHGEPPERLGPEPKTPQDPPQRDGDPRGVVLSGGTFLGPREICKMRVVPELIFVNCCHLAARNTDQLFRPDDGQLGGRYNRARFAAGVAEELIKIGVRCVLAAGWAVEDAAASTFATTFYDALLRGRRFADAVAEARRAALALGGNTWAAYQCYGDPDWTLRREIGDAQRPTPSVAEELAGVASSASLRLALESLAVKSKFQGARAADQRARVRHLEARFASLWGGIGEVAEAFGAACAEAGDAASAIAWYRKALTASDGSASLKTMEQLGNLQARMAWGAVDEARQQRDQRALGGAIRSARREIRQALDLLTRVAALQPSMERESVCGSACKRLALVESIAGREREEARAIEKMRLHYERAETLARDGHLPDLFYPALNRMAAELVVHSGGAGGREWKGLDAAAVEAVRQSLATKVREDPDFWSIVGQIELSLYEALARGGLATTVASIVSAYEDLRTRVSATWMWASVRDQVQFVLPKYAKRASPAEREAVETLVGRLDALAVATGGPG